jgi:hypothetical protein
LTCLSRKCENVCYQILPERLTAVKKRQVSG